MALLVDLQLLHQGGALQTADPHTWPFSRLRLAAIMRIRPTVGRSPEHHWPPSSPATTSSRERWPLKTTLRDPSSVPSLQMEDGSKVIFLVFTLSSSFSPQVLRSPTLALRNASFVAESFARPSSPCAPFPALYLPSPVSAPIRYGWCCGWRRCSKVAVSSPFFGSLLDSPFFVL